MKPYCIEIDLHCDGVFVIIHGKNSIYKDPEAMIHVMPSRSKSSSCHFLKGSSVKLKTLGLNEALHVNPLEV